MKKIVVLISGRGSNLEAICKSGLSKHIECIISNNPNAKGLDFAKIYKTPSAIINSKLINNKELFEKQLIAVIDGFTPDLIVLAGFMKILSPEFIKYYQHKIINIHPSLLPAFKGKQAQLDAYNAKVKVSGATIHLVDELVDNGAIIAQGVVDISKCCDDSEVANNILELEHVLYPFVIKQFIQGKINFANGVVQSQVQASDFEELGELKQHIFI